MKLYYWKGTLTYEYLVVCGREEIEKLIKHFSIDPAAVCGAEGDFYYFVDTRRMRIALPPFLSIIFGGQYNSDLPTGGQVYTEGPVMIDYNEYGLEKFRF